MITRHQTRSRLAALALVSAPVMSAGASVDGDVGAATTSKVSLWSQSSAPLSLGQAALPKFPGTVSAVSLPQGTVDRPIAAPTPVAPQPPAAESSIDSLVEQGKNGLISSFKSFIADNLIGALITAGIVLYGAVRSLFRIFPNKIHLDTFAVGVPHAQLAKEGSKKVFLAQTMLVSSLSEIFGKNLPAIVAFNVAMWSARFNSFWPTLRFSNGKVLRTLLRSGPHEILVRPFRSYMSSLFSDELVSESGRAAARRYRSREAGKGGGFFQSIQTNFVVCTYERVCDVQPRAYMIPHQDVVNFLIDVPTLYEAAKNTGGGATKRLVRLLEICGAIVLRYPTALANLGLERDLPRATQVATELFRMYALEPKDSEAFLARYVQGDRTHITPSSKEISAICRLWYGTKDVDIQRQREKAEREMTSFFQYDWVCKENGIPTWLFFVALPNTEDRQ